MTVHFIAAPSWQIVLDQSEIVVAAIRRDVAHYRARAIISLDRAVRRMDGGSFDGDDFEHGAGLAGALSNVAWVEIGIS